ncbi:helix-turn-helix domain-containing protein [Neotamlana laminarinivorans]|uniref:Helix-turn-helix domain-containing protein n=1 Tax=Neotamlana laminarinivorans TaxID=2883124 RepID=A0A9X1I1L4_9FLAO|nr:helix-turn-helix domain-containing protein [Tamlana laminarinivorans]MCB4800134.1 helix-turn-helix domain-containing protein [Tamlana laminarinivorans]
MSVKILTTDDLENFKVELLEDLKELLTTSSQQKPRKWIKSSEVRKLLGVSPGTLQNMRANGTLPYTKFGNLMYYNAELINQMLENNQVANVYN